MLFPFFGRHCTAMETKATTKDSDRLSSRAANSMKGTFIDMFPFKPGRDNFIRDAAAERITKQAKRTRSADSHRSNPKPSTTRAAAATRPTNILADCGVLFMDSLSMSFSCSLLLYCVFADDFTGCFVNQEVATFGLAEGFHGAVKATPQNAVSPDHA